MMIKTAKPLVHLEDIEPKIVHKQENFYMGFYENFRERLLGYSLRLTPSKSFNSLSKLINVNDSSLWASFKRNSVSLSILQKLSKLLTGNVYKDFNLKSIENEIKFIKGAGCKIRLYAPKFPFRFDTPEGVRIISRLYHDGGIKSNGQPFYCNSDKLLIEEFCNDVKTLFGDIKLNIVKDSQNVFLVRLPHFIGDILEVVGVRRGSKILNDPEPPMWISELEEGLIEEYLRVAFDDEGSVNIRNVSMNIAREITNDVELSLKDTLLKMSLLERTRFLRKQLFVFEFVPKILKFDRMLLEKLSIKSSEPKLEKCYTDKKKEKLRTIWHITISSKENLQKFYEKVGFKLPYKIEKLKLYLDNTRSVAEDGKSLENMLKVAIPIEKEKGYFLCDELAKKLGYRIEWVRKVLKEGKKRDLLNILGRMEDRRIKYTVNVLWSSELA